MPLTSIERHNLINKAGEVAGKAVSKSMNPVNPAYALRIFRGRIPVYTGVIKQGEWAEYDGLSISLRNEEDSELVMNGLQVVSLLLYLVVLGVQYWLNFINIRHMKENAMNVPGGFEEHIDKETLKKVCAYAGEKSVFGLAQSLFGSALLLLIVFGGLLNHYNAWISSLDLPFIVEGTLFFLILSWLSRFISIPFDLYHTFGIERRYGFNTSTLRLWSGDFIKTLLLSSFLYGALLLGGFWIVQQSREKWWLFVWALFLFFSFFLMYISPYVIEPLFNKFSPGFGQGGALSSLCLASPLGRSRAVMRWNRDGTSLKGARPL